MDAVGVSSSKVGSRPVRPKLMVDPPDSELKSPHFQRSSGGMRSMNKSPSAHTSP